MAKSKKYGLLPILLVMMVCLSGCGGNSGDASRAADPSEQDHTAQMVIPIVELTSEPRFYDWNQNGTAMQLIALKSSTGDVQLAYNTCQSCAGSPYAYFEYQNGVLVCQNCLNQFGLDSVGRVAGGCNPMPVTEYQIENDQAIISAEELAKTAPSFRNWKVIR